MKQFPGGLELGGGSRSGFEGASGPAVREGAADDELQRVIDHYRQQDQPDCRVTGEDESGHGHTGSEGLFRAAEDGSDAVFRWEMQGVANKVDRPHHDEEKQNGANKNDEESAFGMSGPDVPFHGIAKGGVHQQQDGTAVEAVDEFFVARRPIAEQRTRELAGDQWKHEPEYEVENDITEWQGVAAGFEFQSNPEWSQEDPNEAGECGVENCNGNVAPCCCRECDGGGDGRWQSAQEKEAEAQVG